MSLAVVLVLVGGLGGWASTAQISGALIAPGSIVVDSNVKKVQHPTGGVVAELRARDGDLVQTGDVLVRLDDTVAKASLSIVTKTLNGLLARRARLEAERGGAATVAFPPALVERAKDPDVEAVMTSEAKLFDVRLAERMGQRAQLRERIAQLQQEIVQLKLDLKAHVHPDVSIEVDDVDDVHERAVAAGAEIVYPLTDEEWGLRRFFVRDPNGAVINVTEHRA